MDFALNLITNLIAAIVIFLLGLFWPVIPKSFRRFQLRKFWGKGVLGQDFVIAYGALRNTRHRQTNPPRFWYDKYYSDGTYVELVGPRGNIVSGCEIRSTSYIINTLSTYRKKAVAAIDDTASFPNLNRTFVALGSPSSNEITRLAMREPNNMFLEFMQKEEDYFIHDKKTDKRFKGFQPPIKKDYGIILKLPNLRFQGHFFFVCAGLGEWGTSGSSWYLANKWIELKKEFGDTFGIVVEVDIGSDESARRVFP